jgi:hypothetical protein
VSAVVHILLKLSQWQGNYRIKVMIIVAFLTVQLFEG